MGPGSWGEMITSCSAPGAVTPSLDEWEWSGHSAVFTPGDTH